MMTVFVMTLGELNYADTLMPWDKLEYAALTNILFFLFVLGMPIILMNMLVSNNRLRSWRDSRPSASAFMANGRKTEPRSREGIEEESS